MGRILDDLTQPKPEPKKPVNPYAVDLPINIVKPSLSAQIRMAKIDFDHIDVLPGIDPEAKPIQSNHPTMRMGFAAGSQRVTFKRPVRRGEGRTKLFAKDTPKTVRSNPAYVGLADDIDVNTKARKRPQQIILRPGERDTLAKAGIDLNLASTEQVSGPTFASFLLVDGEGTQRRIFTARATKHRVLTVLGRINEMVPF